MRIGVGYDAHRLVKGRKLILGGVEIPFVKGLEGHSDADVLCHAIGDAVLGAAGLGDLGQHYPNTDPRWRGVSSLFFLQDITAKLRDAGYRIVNVDSTVLIEAPRLAPHLRRMRETMAEALEIEVDQIAVKATTTEGLGFTGRGEGIAAHAVVLIEETKGSEKQ